MLRQIFPIAGRASDVFHWAADELRSDLPSSRDMNDVFVESLGGVPEQGRGEYV